ncbi:MAG: hypothetical protein KJ062_11240 [Thermoanaerobaculia bacterium]|nr:hypothetical protein [Thermoanaerobaculia bacterium]
MVLDWLFGRRGKAAPEDGLAPRVAEGVDERLGPEPPPLPTTNRPGVTGHAATALARLEPAPSRPGASLLGPAPSAIPGDDLSWAAVALSGAARGDVLLSGRGPIDLAPGTPVLREGVAAKEEEAPQRLGREALVGRGVPGITGARLLHVTEGRAVLRFGPPPGARWAVVGLRSVAVFEGKLTLVDGEEARDVRAGEAALVADPAATLYVQAGNDAAVAIAFAAPGVLIRLQ